ncbi:Rrf2 family transcriptional regulator [Helcococcus bovis]|uniref:RrF2 family transcriptional regulator n=1 Tax=Helcococcus bovis TaxID=3153252 RepID=UPI0038B6C92A
MNLTTKSEYGLRALSYLRDKYDQGPINISEISIELKLSKTYIEQIFRKLKKANIIESYRGKEGGYKLKNNPSEINVGHVIRILEGNIELSHKCNDEKCSIEGCASRQVFSKIDNAVSNVIDHITLDQI